MSKRRYLHFLILLVLGLILYSNAFNSPFVYDDRWFIVQNAHIRYLSNFLDLSGTRYVGFLSFALNYAVGGYEPFGYNLANIIIHIINSMLVYTLVSLMLDTPAMEGDKAAGRAMPLICSLIFLVHPIETQAVNYISQRFASLATLFYLLSVCSFLKARLYWTVDETGGAKRYVFYAISLIAAVIAQKTKEISFTLPFVIISFEFIFFSAREETLKRLPRLIPFLATLAIIPLSILLPDAGGPDHAFTTVGSIKKVQMELLTSLSSYDYLMTQFRVIVTYLRLLVFPVNQNLLHAYPKYYSILAPQILASFIFLVSIFSFSVYWLFRSKRKGDGLGLMLSTGLLWFFVTISTESSVIPLLNVIFEHRLYLPSVGFFIAAVAAFLYLLRFVVERYGPGSAEPVRKAAWVVVVAAIVFLAVLSFKRNIVWSSELRLWQDVVYKNPGDNGAQTNLGLAYSRAGDAANAKKHFNEAIRIKPESSKPYNNLGYLYFIEHDYKNALIYYRESLRFDYDSGEGHNNIANVYKELGDTKSAIFHYKEAARLKPFSDEIIFNLAVFYKTTGDIEKAKEGYADAIRLAPSRGDYHLALAVLYRDIEELDRAIIHFKEAIRLSPELEDGHLSLASIYFARGSYEEAVLYFKRALEVNPANDDTHYNLATTYRVMGNAVLSKKHYLDTIRLKPNSADARYYLGLVYAAENRPEEAKKEFREALSISPGFGAAETELNRLLKSRKNN